MLSPDEMAALADSGLTEALTLLGRRALYQRNYEEWKAAQARLPPGRVLTLIIDVPAAGGVQPPRFGQAELARLSAQIREMLAMAERNWEIPVVVLIKVYSLQIVTELVMGLTPHKVPPA